MAYGMAAFGNLADTPQARAAAEQQRVATVQQQQTQQQDSRMRQIQLEQQEAELQRMHQDASAAPGSVRWDGGSSTGVSGGGGGGSRSSGSGGAGTGTNPALDGLLAEIRNQQVPQVTPTHYTPQQVASGISPEANAATYGAAKERTGLAMQAAMRGLRGSLAQRGIVGTGIDAEEQGMVYNQGLGQLGDVDRTIAHDDATRQLAADQANAMAGNQAGQFNAGQDLAAQQANMQAANQRQNILLQLASLY
jgi:hypothetical protein